MSYVRSVRFAGGLMAAILVAGPVGAAVAPKKDSPIAAKEFRHPQLQVENRLKRVEDQAAPARTPLLDALAQMRVASQFAYVDPRTGRFATLMPAEPLLPGTGEGNRRGLGRRGRGPALRPPRSGSRPPGSPSAPTSSATPTRSASTWPSSRSRAA